MPRNRKQEVADFAAWLRERRPEISITEPKWGKMQEQTLQESWSFPTTFRWAKFLINALQEDEAITEARGQKLLSLWLTGHNRASQLDDLEIVDAKASP